MRQTNIQLGLKENWKQFILLLIVNAFVGGMVGLERTILPQLAEEEFLVVVTSAVLSFIIVFGVVKAITIYFNVCPTLELDYNLNDGMIWGILPIILANRGFNLKNIAIIVAVYPAVWGVGQLVTGKLSDHYNKKRMLFIGMALQGMALVLMFWSTTYLQFMMLSSLLGVGTAIVYPTFLSAISNFTNPNQRAQSIGTFRLWRDLGYAFGALLTIVIAQFFEVDITMVAIGILTILSSIIIKIRMT